MGIDKLINDISQKNNIEFIKYKNVYYVNSSDSRVMFILEIKNIEDVEKFIEELDMDDFYKKFHKYLSEKDTAIKFNLKSFLWDLYVIAIHNCKENKLNNLEKLKIEKDRFVARKIIIEDGSEDLIKEKLINIINPLDEFEKLLLDDISTPDEEIDNALNDLLSDPSFKNRFEKVTENLDEDISSKEKVLNYLDYIANTENYEVKEGEHSENK